MREIKCPRCNGEGKILGIFPIYTEDYKGERKPYIELPCNKCNQTGIYKGYYNPEQGEPLRKKRLDNDLSLREFAKKFNLDVVKVSDVEQGYSYDKEIIEVYASLTK